MDSSVPAVAAHAVSQAARAGAEAWARPTDPAEFDEMGHRPLQAEIGRELPTIAAARSGDELTDAERRVVDQIAIGVTSQKAAAALVLRVRTVESHVASIYRKLGVRTRSELRRTLSPRGRERGG